MSKSKSTQQRRVKGQHADPMQADVLLDVAPPSSNSGLMFLQQMKRDVQETTAPVPTTPSEEELTSLRTEARLQVRKLFEEKGEAGVQSFLQQQIQGTKKKESDIAVAKKRGDAAAREKDLLVAELHRITTAKTHAEMQCKSMQTDIKKQDDEVQKASAELAANRADVRVKIERDVKELEEKMKAMEAEDVPLTAENEQLKEEASKLKREFDEAFKAYEVSWQGKEQETSTLVKNLQSALQRTELLDAKLLLVRKEAKMMMDAISVFKEQVGTYEDRFSAFDEVTIRSEEVERVTAMQKAKLQERLQSAEQDKKDAHDIRVQLEKETVALRAKIAALKKKLSLLEKAKTAAEAKCRAVQKQ